MKVNDNARGPLLHNVVHDIVQQGAVGCRHKGFWNMIGEGTKSDSQTGTKKHYVHCRVSPFILVSELHNSI